MRIAVVTNVLPPEGRGGAEAYAAHEAATLAEDHDVLVISGSADGNIGRARLANVPHLGHLATDAPLSRKLVWHARDQWRLSVHRATGEALSAFRPDVVHSHAVQGLSAAVFTAIGRSGLPHVHTAHDLSLLCARTTMTRDSEYCGGRCAMCQVQRAVRGRAVQTRLSTLVAVSEYIRGRHVDWGIVSPDRAVVLRLGADGEEPRVRKGVGPGIHVGFIGTVASHKGIRTLLQVFRSAPAGWRLTIAGAGPLEAEVAAAVAERPEQIRFAGQISGEAKTRFYDEIDLLVIPSEWEEPAALVGTEAAAHAIPMIVSDRGGLPELPEVRIFRSGDANGLHDAIAWFAEDPGRVEEISGRLFARREEFTWSTHLANLTRLLDAAAREAQPGENPR